MHANIMQNLTAARDMIAMVGAELATGDRLCQSALRWLNAQPAFRSLSPAEFGAIAVVLDTTEPLAIRCEHLAILGHRDCIIID